MIEALYVILSCRYHLAFRAGPLPLPYPVTLPERTCAPEPLSLVPPGTLLMSSFRACHCRICTCTPGPSLVVLCPSGCPTAAVRQSQSPCGLEQKSRRKKVFTFDHLPPFLRFSRRCVPNAVDHVNSLNYVSWVHSSSRSLRGKPANSRRTFCRHGSFPEDCAESRTVHTVVVSFGMIKFFRPHASKLDRSAETNDAPTEVFAPEAGASDKILSPTEKRARDASTSTKGLSRLEHSAE